LLRLNLGCLLPVCSAKDGSRHFLLG
jgi:hypothetical protein